MQQEPQDPEIAFQAALTHAYNLSSRRAYTRREMLDKLAQRGHGTAAAERAVARLMEVVGVS